MLARLGFVASVLTENISTSRTCRLQNATRPRVRELIRENFHALDRVVDFLERRRILLYRVTSNLIPFGSHRINRLRWWDEFAEDLAALGRRFRSLGIRVSTHPGQYTVLNSPTPAIVEAAVAELEYHARLLDALGADRSSKIVLHDSAPLLAPVLPVSRAMTSHTAPASGHDPRARPGRVRPGEPLPLGARWDGRGTNFSLFSEVASRVELCLFDEHGAERRLDLPERTAFCWHGYVPGIGPGQRYGFRVHGPWDPSQGHRCNPAKLLLDPYARAVTGDIQWDDAVFPYPLGGDDLQPDTRDSAPFVAKGVVVDDAFDWNNDVLLRRPLHETVIYEVHVKGFTARHPDVPEALRGTYAGLAHPAALEHLTRLGVTAVELLPVHQFVHEKHLLKKGLRNYWGYHSIGYFAPHGGYASGGDAGAQVCEFKAMVKALHAAGFEVILDVVYNHTGEGNHLGPMLSLKGIDNRAYYRVVEGDARFYMDYTGTGNSLNMRHPHALQLVMDSLRYWVEEMHVDGFRFDLASTLARELYDVDRLSAFFDIIHQDPTLAGVKLIAEPWDIGEGGYQVGNFPVRWCEWNGKYRDTVRDFWRGEGQTLAEVAYRLTGSADLYEDDGRKPYASVNFVTAHDGFTLRDLVSYNEKHNEANGEENRDGESHNRSWNCGAEGPTDDAAVVELRSRQTRNFLTTMLLSQGIPMLLGGDEMGRTQGGNNNAYCQDNEISWFDWEAADADLLAFTRRLVALMRTHPVFQRRRWFKGRLLHGTDVADIAWFRFDGGEMSEEDWQAGFAKSLAVFLNGDALRDVDADGQLPKDDSFLLVLNAHHEPLPCALPPERFGAAWRVEVDTTTARGDADRTVGAGEQLEVPARSMRRLASTSACTCASASAPTAANGLTRQRKSTSDLYTLPRPASARWSSRASATAAARRSRSRCAAAAASNSPASTSGPSWRSSRCRPSAAPRTNSATGILKPTASNSAVPTTTRMSRRARRQRSPGR